MIYFIKNQRSLKHIKSSPFKVILINHNNLLLKNVLKFYKIPKKQNLKRRKKIKRKIITKQKIIKFNSHNKKEIIKISTKKNRLKSTQIAMNKMNFHHHKPKAKLHKLINIIILTRFLKNQVKLQTILLNSPKYSHLMSKVITKNKIKCPILLDN